MVTRYPHKCSAGTTPQTPAGAPAHTRAPAAAAQRRRRARRRRTAIGAWRAAERAVAGATLPRCPAAWPGAPTREGAATRAGRPTAASAASAGRRCELFPRLATTRARCAARRAQPAQATAAEGARTARRCARQRCRPPAASACAMPGT
eukprot:scaffold23116_cov103-Isochrysis_galbana.AAC.6